MDLLNGLIYGMFGGGIIAGFGYLKNMKKEDFDFKKAGLTVIIGMLAGAVLSQSQSQNLDIGSYDLTAFSGMISYAVENTFKMLNAGQLKRR